MSEKTQLTRITVPAITDTRYVEGIADAFDKINDNFKKIASLPFLQGVQGDSYQLEEYKIWNDDWTITEDGKILLDSIFGKDITVDGNSFDIIRNYIGEELDGVSPLDFFVTEDGNTIINNALYFYVIKDDTGNVIEKQLGQYYYFVDGRLKSIGNIYNGDVIGVSLDGFNDYTGFYQYRYNPKSYEQKYLKVEILPSIYYDQDKNDICWKFNGNETGISAIGVKGADGKDADLLIVRVTANENDCTGLVNAIINPIGGNTSEEQWIDDPGYFKVGKALICIQRDNVAQDFAYGQVIKAGSDYNAYWEPNYNFSKLIGNNRITNYFYNMGDDDTGTAPFYLAIPSSYDRTPSGTEKTKAHVIKGSSETSDDLNIFYSDNAFGVNGEQSKVVTASSSIKNLNIQNYNTQISKKLTVSGSAEVSGGLTVNSGKFVGKSGAEVFDGLTVQDGGLSVNSGDLSITDNAAISKKLTVSGSVEVSGGLTVKNGGAVISSGGIQVTTEKPSVMTGNAKVNVNSNVLKGHNNPGNTGCEDFPADITKGGYPLVTMSYNTDGSESKDCLVFGNGDIYALKWDETNKKYIPGTLFLQDRAGYFGKTIIGGSFEVNGTSKLNGITTISSTQASTNKSNGALVVTGGVGVSGAINIGGTLGVTGAATFGSAVTASSTLSVGTNLTVSGQSTLVGKVSITGGAGSNNTTSGALVVTGGVGISEKLNVGNSTNIAGITKITNNTSSTNTTSGALVVTGGVGISENLHIGERLVVNDGGVNNFINPSKIYGSNAKTGGTTDGGTGLEIYGGSGRETNDQYHGAGGVGLVVTGGSAGKFTGSTSSLAGYGGTGLVVYGGQAGEGPGGVTNTGHTGSAIKTYGNIEIGDRGGSYTTTLSSGSNGLKIDENTTIDGEIKVLGNTILGNSTSDKITINAWNDIGTISSATTKNTSEMSFINYINWNSAAGEGDHLTINIDDALPHIILIKKAAGDPNLKFKIDSSTTLAGDYNITTENTTILVFTMNKQFWWEMRN